MRFYLFILLLLTGLRFSTQAQTFTSSSGGVIADNAGPTCFPITVTGVGTLDASYGVAHVCVKLSHNYDADLELYLIAPDGTSVALSTNNGGSGDNYNTTCFGDYAATSITAGTAPFNGFYQPEGVLNSVNNGQSGSGTWQLCIYDDASGNVGTLINWTISFTDYPQGPPACAANPAAADLCSNATAICALDGYCGNTSTVTYTADYWPALGSGSQGTGAACMGIQNNSWLTFTAASSTISFDCWVFNSTNGQGLQLMVFNGACNGAVNSVFCNNHIAPNNAAPTLITITGLTPGTQYFIMLDGNAGDYCDYIINANSGFSVPAVTPSSSAICQGGSVSLTASGGNGTYSWSPSTGLSTTSGATVISTPPVGTTVYSVSSTTLLGCPYSATASVVVTAPASATINYSTPFCTTYSGTAPVTHTGTNGGTYTASPAGLTINSATGAITPSTSTPGTYTISYTVPATGGCAAYTATKMVTITAAPTAAISYAGTPYCSNAGSVSVSLTGTTGGVYTAAPAGLSINSGTGAINTSSGTAGTYTVTYTVAAAGGCAAVSATAGVTITTLPAATISYAGSPFCSSTASGAVTRTGTAGGTYTATPAGLTINAGTGAIVPSSSTAGTYTVSYTIAAAGGCAAVTATATVVITAAPNATISYAGSPFCSSAAVVSVTRTGTAGGSYAASPAGLSINAASGAVTPSGSTAGTYTVTYTIAAASGCPAFTTTTTVIITANPSATIAYAGSPYCGNAGTASVTRTGTTGGAYTASPAGLTISASTGAVALSSSTPGTYTVTYTIAASGGCPAFTTTASIIVTAAPTAAISYASSPFCINAAAGSVTQTGTSGGSYTVSPTGLSINAATGAVMPSASTAGTYTVSYTVAAANGCPAFTTTASVVITANPSATIAYAGSPYCSNSGTAAVTRTGTAGGVYTASPAGLTINSGTGTITPSASTPGAYTITYTVAASGGCPAFTTTTSVIIIAAPTAAISYTGSPFCISSAAVSVTQAGTSGGNYTATPAGLSINTATGTITPSASTAGTYTVTYTIAAANGCSAYTTTANVVITTTPSATISYPGSPYCSNSGAATVTRTGTAGGTYTAAPAGLTINAGTGAITPSSSTPGTYTVTYTVAAASGCPAFSTTTTVTITAAPGATVIYPGSPFCGSTAAGAVTQTGTTGGAYSASPAGLAINASTGLITPSASAAGTYAITYTIAAANGCAAFTASTSVIINAAPSATITYTGSPYCSNTGTVAVNHTGAAGGSYSALPSGLSINVGTGAVNTAGSTAGIYVVTYSIAAASGCPAFTDTAAITIIAAPTAAISYLGNPFCSSGSAVSVSQAGTAGGSYSSTTGLSLNTVSGAINPSASTAGTYVVTYNVSTGTCTASDTANVMISPAPAATIAYSGSPYCTNGSTVAVTQTGSSGGAYSASPAGLSINSGTGAVTSGSSTAGSYTVTYTVPAASGCPAFTTTAQVTLNAPPTAAISYAGGPFCTNGAAVNVTQTGAGGGTYSSTSGLNIDLVTGQISLTGSSAGTYTVSYTLPAANGCGPVAVTTAVTLTAPPAATISYATPLCKSAPGTSAVTLSGTTGGNYSASPSGLSLSSTTGAITPSSSTVGNYTVTYTVAAANGCAAFSTTAQVTISSAPSAAVSYPGSPFCSSLGAVSVTQTGSGGGSYTASPSGLSINAGTGAVNLAASAAGTYTVTYTIPAANTCVSFSTTTSIAVTTAPTAAVSYAGSPYCSSAGAVTITQAGTSGGGYTAAPAGLSINGSTGAVTPGTSIAGSYVVTYTLPASGGCPAFTDTANITVTAAPTAAISYSGSPFCSSNANVINVNQTGTTSGSYTAASGLSLDAASGAINIAGSTAGNYTITYSLPAAGGCPALNATAAVVITQAPSATIHYNGVFCQSAPGTASVVRTGTGGGAYSASPAGLSINAANGAITPGTSTPGNYTVTYAIAASGGCPAFTATTNVSVTTAPTAAISYAGSPYCSNAGAAMITLSGNSGGTFSASSGLALDAMSGAIDLAASTAGTYTVTYSIPAANGCVAFSTSATVTVTTAPSAVIDYPASPYCTGGGTATVSQTGNTGGQYSAVPAGLSINTATGTVTLASSTAGTYVVSYIIAGSNGCPAFTASDTVVINATPAAPVVTTPVNYCEGDSALALTPNGAGYFWYTTATGSAGTATFTPATSIPATINRYVSYTENGCESSRSLVTTHVYPTYSNAIAISICNGQSYSFGGSAYSTTGIYNHAFATIHGCDSAVQLSLTVNPVYNDTSNITICQGQTYSFGGTTYTTSGTHNHLFNSVSGCDSVVLLNLNVINTIRDTIVADICQGQTYPFNNTTYGATGNYSATFPATTGCDSVETLHLTVHPVFNQTLNAAICQGESYVFAGNSYAATGSYPHTFTSQFGCDSTINLALIVNPVITNTDSAAICYGQTYTWGGNALTAAGTYVDTFAAATTCDSIVTLMLTVNPIQQTALYDSICNGQSYVFAGNSYTISGTYSALFQTIHGCDSTVLLHLFVKPKPVPPVVATPVVYCQFVTTVPLAAAGQNILWYDGPGTTGYATAPLPTTDTAGTATWLVTQSIDGCESDAASLSVIVNAKPPLPLAADTVICQYAPVVALSAVGENLLWYAGASGGTGNSSPPVIQTSDVSTVTWYVSQTINGCEGDRAPVTAYVIARPVASFTVTPNPACQYDTVALTFDGSGNATMDFNWQYPDGLLAAGSGIGPLNISYPDSGTKTITLVVTDRGCSSNTATQSLTVKPVPVAGFQMPDEGCIGEKMNVALNYADVAGAHYSWNFGGGGIVFGENGGPYDIIWNTTGLKYVTLIAGYNGCNAPPVKDSILIHPAPTAKITTVSDASICAYDTVRFEGYTDSGYSYHWSPDNFVTDSSTDGAAAVIVPRSGFVFLTTTNQWGCTSTDSVLIATTACCTVSLPTAFTPNGDGRNDVFRMIGDGHHEIKSFRIVNRWGQEIFETKDSRQGWDGTFNGVPQEMGTYYYFLRFKCATGEVVEQKGDVTLIR